MTNLKKPTLDDLFRMHAEGRGSLVERPEDADVTFGLHEGSVRATDTSTILSEFLKS